MTGIHCMETFTGKGSEIAHSGEQKQDAEGVDGREMRRYSLKSASTSGTSGITHGPNKTILDRLNV